MNISKDAMMKPAKPKNPLAVAFGAHVRARRTALRMKQDALGRAVGYGNHTSIAKIEKGIALPALDKALAIADALGVSLLTLLRPESPQPLGDREGASSFLDVWPRERLRECTVVLRALTDGIEAYAEELLSSGCDASLKG